MKTKLITSNSIRKFEVNLQELLNRKAVNVIDVKFSTSNKSEEIVYSALVLYDDEMHV